MNTKHRKFYWFTLILLLVVSAYPIYMGTFTMIKYLQQGFINASEYQKYIIPYTPLCISILLTVVLLPAAYKLFKHRSLLILSIFGIILFALCETGLEQIKVVEGYKTIPLESWQYSLCVATPQVLQSIGEPIYAQNNPAFKIHFYLIALVILLSTISLVYGYYRMAKENNFNKKRPLFVQLLCVVLFTGLCIYACFTAFYRNGLLSIPPISSVLMSLFFILFGVTFGVYFGSLLYKKSKLLSIALPTFIALSTTLAMYFGEWVLLGGKLFKMGSGIIFEPLTPFPFAVLDVVIILLSGFITYRATQLLNKK